MNRFLFFLVVSTLVWTTGCFHIDEPYTALAPGPWRAELELEPRMNFAKPGGTNYYEKLQRSFDINNVEFEEVTLGILPFNFEVVYDNETDFHINIINGDERIRVDSIVTGLDRSTAKDTIEIHFPLYDTYIKGRFEEGILEGYWHVNYKNNYAIPFRAEHGKQHRFTNINRDPIADIDGNWAVQFELDTEHEYPAVAEFQQNANQLRGTFRTETGDYRFLDGSVQGDKLYLSCFDGAHAFLFEGKLLDQDKIIGSFRSGNHYQSVWAGQRDPAATLASADTLTYLRDGYDRFDFSFPNTKGETISLDDPRWAGKVKLIQIMGTWCPNCRDESQFLNDYIAANPHEDLAVIGLAFERYRDTEKVKPILDRYAAKIPIYDELLHAGYYNKKEANEQLPMLNHILSYPTMILLDRDNNVRYIHTGFSGPATSSFSTFTQEFEARLKALLNQQ